MTKRTVLAFFIILFVYPLWGQKSTPVSNPVFPDTTARGRLLAEYDVAAWHATDAVLALKPEKHSGQKYIAKKTDSGWVVAFGYLNESRDKYVVVYEAFQEAKPEEFTVKKYDPPLEDTGFYLTGVKAIEKAFQDFQRPNRPYNTYVLPAPANQLYVYLLPAQTTNDVFPLGGDVRYLFSADGNTLVEKKQLHKTILEIRPSDAPGKTVAGTHSHVLTNLPEDTDVFHVLSRKPSMPEYVGTPDGHVYSVEVDGSIRIVK